MALFITLAPVWYIDCHFTFVKFSLKICENLMLMQRDKITDMSCKASGCIRNTRCCGSLVWAPAWGVGMEGGAGAGEQECGERRCLGGAPRRAGGITTAVLLLPSSTCSSPPPPAPLLQAHRCSSYSLRWRYLWASIWERPSTAYWHFLQW